MSNIHFNVSFNTSAPDISKCPPPDISEIVFLGRSNVGKSSLINALSNQKKLAKSSSTPGKTKLINFFDGKFKLNEREFKFRFVDLPGFGFAKVSKAEKEDWEEKLTEFLLKRSSIRVFLQLIDSRHPELDIDKGVTQFLKGVKRGDQKIYKVFTKIDKLKANDKAKLKQKYKGEIFTSSEKKIDIEILKKAIIEHTFGDIFES